MSVSVRLLDGDRSQLAEHVFQRPSREPVEELVLEHDFGLVDGVVTVRIRTERPGWVIWYEVEVFGE